MTVASSSGLTDLTVGARGDLLALTRAVTCTTADAQTGCNFTGGTVPWIRPTVGQWSARDALADADAVGVPLPLPQVAALDADQATVLVGGLAGSALTAQSGSLGGPWSTVTLDPSPGESSRAVLAAAGGQTLAAWRSGNNLVTASRAPDGTWTSPQVVYTGSPQADARGISLAVNPSGDAVAAWIAQSNVMAATRSGGVWTTPAQQATVYSIATYAAIDDGGHATVAWAGQSAKQAPWYDAYAVTADAGGSFGPASNFGRTDDGAGGLPIPLMTLTASGNESLLAVGNDPGRVLLISKKGAGAWAQRQVVGYGERLFRLIPNAPPSVALNRNGAAILVWPAGTGLAATYRASSDASWAPRVFVAAGLEIGDWEPTALLTGVDQNGTAHAVWDTGNLPPALRAVDVDAQTTGIPAPRITITLLSKTTRAVVGARAVRVRVVMNAAGRIRLATGTARALITSKAVTAGRPSTLRVHLSNAAVHAIKRARAGRATVGLTADATADGFAPASLHRRLKLR